MTSPVVTARVMRTYRQQQEDIARRRRNRMLALAALIVVAGIVFVQLWR